MTPDLQYKTYGMFTSFYPVTEQGKIAWNELACKTEGTGKVLCVITIETVRQLRAAGYIVHKAR